MPLPPRIAKGTPKPARRSRPGMSAAHVEFVRRLPCLGCGKRPGGFAHHLITGMVAIGERGQGRRAADRYAVPTCERCHVAAFPGSIHWLGSDEAFYVPRGIDHRAVADALWRSKGDLEAMQRVVFRARQMAVPVVLDRRARVWRPEARERGLVP
jgi:hypothetical protein